MEFSVSSIKLNNFCYIIWFVFMPYPKIKIAILKSGREKHKKQKNKVREDGTVGVPSSLFLGAYY